jgi:type II secretory pathway predicted ATPase ExeA
MLIRLLQDDLRRMGCRVAAINLSAADSSCLAQQIAEKLAIPRFDQSTVAAGLLQIREELLGRTRCGRQIVLLLDDAHRCDTSAAAGIDFLASVAESCQGRFSLVTAGDAGLDNAHARRCPMRIRLKPLTDEEAHRFLQQRLLQLGIPRERITSSALRTLVEGTQGLPRRLLHVCDLVKAVYHSNAASEIRPTTASAVLSTGMNRAA